jgi:hypothetical protein
MNNLFLHIILPKGLALTNGQTLMSDTTIDVVSSLSPFYAGIGQVKLAGGTFIRKTSDMAIACAIYNASQEADLITPYHWRGQHESTEEFQKFSGARTQWVIAKAAKELILNLLGLYGVPGGHVLANFSVTRGRTSDEQGISAKIADLDNHIKEYEVAIRSGAHTLPGGHARPGFAAKGSHDFSERTPSRIWTTTGIGVNKKGWDYINTQTGGRGKPLNFFQQVYFSPTVVNYRSGIFLGGYPLRSTYYLL